MGKSIDTKIHKFFLFILMVRLYNSKNFLNNKSLKQKYGSFTQL